MPFGLYRSGYTEPTPSRFTTPTAPSFVASRSANVLSGALSVPTGTTTDDLMIFHAVSASSGLGGPSAFTTPNTVSAYALAFASTVDMNALDLETDRGFSLHYSKVTS